MEWTVKLKKGDRKYSLPLGARTVIMGVLNTSPDSFSGDGISSPKEAILKAEELVKSGADIIDVGGQSTRPGAEAISIGEEIRRTAGLINEIVKEFNIPVSIDTYKAPVAEAALSGGASIINDISGLKFDGGMAHLASRAGVPVILMHIKGTPKDMQKGEIIYDDLMGEIKKYLQESINIALKAGVHGDLIIIDPGIGFGKTVNHNLIILKRLRELKELGKPILVGTSRKSMIGKILNLPEGERLEGTAATVALSIANGADIIRVHDVKEIKRVAVMTDAIVRAHEDKCG